MTIIHYQIGIGAQALEICLAKCGHMAWPDRQGYLKRELQGVYAIGGILVKCVNVGKKPRP
ncbi:hypothetical protein N7516_002317 [Penicillium verrucosum]|uniref:uncharacterized protein n=1 Tax=Penicillium verrucosum TaxID=60171 RepID=UPI00254553F5|nr:uncharacterized protein N7516_002317 [Penicillium verrucosum]KAJ5942149.1 hypothetical protein N7516_002317 [Penicillium verrucosum]